jgi:hypothetical protein
MDGTSELEHLLNDPPPTPPSGSGTSVSAAATKSSEKEVANTSSNDLIVNENDVTYDHRQQTANQIIVTYDPALGTLEMPDETIVTYEPVEKTLERAGDDESENEFLSEEASSCTLAST